MQFSVRLIALATCLLGAQQTLACCREGCYSVKGEAFDQPSCAGDLTGASIANYGNAFDGSAAGNCVDVSGDASIKARKSLRLLVLFPLFRSLSFSWRKKCLDVPPASKRASLISIAFDQTTTGAAPAIQTSTSS